MTPPGSVIPRVTPAATGCGPDHHRTTGQSHSHSKGHTHRHRSRPGSSPNRGQSHKRSFGNGTYLTPPRQLSTTTPGAVPPQGTVLAGGSNTWWAVWSEQVGPGGEFAQTELFQAKTYGNDLTRTQVTNNPDNDHQPALAFRPGGGAELVFVRDNAFGNQPTHSYLRLATASGVTGSWAGSQFATVGINTDPSIETTVSANGHTYVAWLRNGQVFESDNRSGAFQAKAFVAHGLSTDIGVSGGRTKVV